MSSQTLIEPPVNAREQRPSPSATNVFPERKLGDKLVLYIDRKLYTGGNNKAFAVCTHRQKPLCQEEFIVVSGCEHLKKPSEKFLCEVTCIGEPVNGVRPIYVVVLETR